MLIPWKFQPPHHLPKAGFFFWTDWKGEGLSNPKMLQCLVAWVGPRGCVQELSCWWHSQESCFCPCRWFSNLLREERSQLRCEAGETWAERGWLSERWLGTFFSKASVWIQVWNLSCPPVKEEGWQGSWSGLIWVRGQMGKEDFTPDPYAQDMLISTLGLIF